MDSPAPPPPGAAQQALLDTFQRHLTAELTGDLAAALATMTADPHVTHVPVLTGGVGRGRRPPRLPRRRAAVRREGRRPPAAAPWLSVGVPQLRPRTAAQVG
jgi:hypothetical protein